MSLSWTVLFTLMSLFIRLDVLLHKIIFFFLFKQKTAYEMRISDWSSDVCSSDLEFDRRRVALLARHDQRGIARQQLLQREDEDRHQDQRGHGDGQAPDDVGQHASGPQAWKAGTRRVAGPLLPHDLSFTFCSRIIPSG